jgi:hypothetical protein
MGGIGHFFSKIIPSVAGYMLGGPAGGLLGTAYTLGNRDHREDAGAAANPYLSQIPGVLKQYAGPIAETGAPTGGEAGRIFQDLLKQYSSMGKDPVEFLNKLQSSYTPSEGYKYKQRQLSSALGNTAAAGGMAGSPYYQEKNAHLTKDLLSEDMQEYLNNLYGIMGTGMQGVEGRAGKATNAAIGLGGGLASALGEQGQLAFHNAQQSNFERAMRNSERNRLFASILSGNFGGGGGLFGGAGGWF